MKLQYLGTAAYEGIPGLFCDCEICRRSRELGGRNIRTRSQAIIDDTLLVDFPPDTYMHTLKFGISLSKVKSCILTHSHSDHLYVGDIGIKKKGYSYPSVPSPLSFYSDKSGYDMITQYIERIAAKPEEANITLISPNVPFYTQGYKITPVRAAHDPKSTPVVYVIEKEGKSIFYSNDTSDYPVESWEYLKKIGVKLNLISLDCTTACRHIDYVGHMNLERCIDIREKFLSYGLADNDTIFVLNHFCHNADNVVYDDFVKIAAEHDFVVSYDGLIIEI